MTDKIIVMDPESAEAQTLKPVAFSELGVLERKHLEKWIERNPEILGTRLLIITTEYDRFDKSDKRLDILALDEKGKLVVVELKRDAARSLADLQAIQYAAFCSQMTLNEVIQLRAEYAGVDLGEAERQIQEFVNGTELRALDNKPRIILASGGFEDQELTSCVLWLRSFGVDISCVEITPYRLGTQKNIILVPRVIIPLPEAKDYIIRTEAKQVAEGQLSPLEQIYLERNTQILVHFRRLMPDKTPSKPPARHYMQVPSGHGGVHFEWWQHGRAQEKMLDVAIHYETLSAELNRELCQLVGKNRRDVEGQLGETLNFQPEWSRNWSAVFLQRKIDPWNEELARWAAEKMSVLISSTQPLMDAYYKAHPKRSSRP